MQSFIFGQNTPWSYEELQKKRSIADELAKSSMNTPRNVGEGLAAIGRALAFRSLDKKASKRDAELKGESEAKWASALGGFGSGASVGGPAFAPPTMSAPMPPVDPNNPHALGDDAMSALGKPPVKTAADPAAIKAGLVARGLPEHVAEGFVMNFKDESGLNPGINEIAPLVPGSRGGFGLYQLTGPRRVAYEKFAAERGVPVDDVDAQLDFLMTELQGPEANAAGAILSTKTPGEAGAAIVNEFLRPSPQYAASRAANYLGGAQPAQGGGMDMAMLADLASDPYATPGQKAVVAALMQQQTQMMDPMYQMQLQREQLELAQLQNPTQDPMAAIELQQAQLDLEQDRAGTGADAATFGTTLQFFTDQDGKLSAGVIGNDGSFKPVDPPGGGEWAQGVDKVDAGTKWVFFDKRTGEKLGEEPKDLRGAETERAIGAAEGEAAGKAITGLGGAIAQADQAIALIDSIAADPALPSITGMFQGRVPPLSQDGTDLNVKITQLQGKAFLEAFESLKGGGAITEREGQAATDAMARLSRAQSTEAYVAALNELKSIMKLGVDRAKSGALSAAPAGAAASGSGLPAGVTQEEWDVMSPEDRALFQ